MRISDWSSDVCSSDLFGTKTSGSVISTLIVVCTNPFEGKPNGKAETKPGKATQLRSAGSSKSPVESTVGTDAVEPSTLRAPSAQPSAHFTVSPLISNSCNRTCDASDGSGLMSKVGVPGVSSPGVLLDAPVGALRQGGTVLFARVEPTPVIAVTQDRKSTRLNSSH